MTKEQFIKTCKDFIDSYFGFVFSTFRKTKIDLLEDLIENGTLSIFDMLSYTCCFDTDELTDEETDDIMDYFDEVMKEYEKKQEQVN